MDTWEYSTLMDFIGDVPDPQRARGQRHRWRVLVTLIAAALVCGQRTGQWVDEHTVELMHQPWVPHRPLPRPSTLRRALQALDVTALEARLAAFSAHVAARTPPAATAGPWQGQSVDGKAVRGANGHGANVHLVSLVQHTTGIVCYQVRVQDKSNEITAVPTLLAGRDLTGTVTTMDALLCQRTIAQHILDQHGHYLMTGAPGRRTINPPCGGAIDVVFRRPHSRSPPIMWCHSRPLTKRMGDWRRAPCGIMVPPSKRRLRCSIVRSDFGITL